MSRNTFVILSSFLSLSLLCQAAHAVPVFRITEIYAGLSGEDGTADWIEVTNFGTSIGDTSMLLFDDENPLVGNAGMLDSFMLAPNESAVFLLDDEAADDDTFATSLEEFEAIWGSGIRVGLTNGGGNLSQNGDQANIGTDNGGSFSVIDDFTFGSGFANTLATIEDPMGMGPLATTTLASFGAFESAPFFNDNLGLPGDSATLIGSPGVAAIPEPSSLAFIGLAGIVVACRRRRSA